MSDVHDDAALTAGGFPARHCETPARHLPAAAAASFCSLLTRSAGCMPSSGTPPTPAAAAHGGHAGRAPARQSPVTAVTSEDASESAGPSHCWAVNGTVYGLSTGRTAANSGG